MIVCGLYTGIYILTVHLHIHECSAVKIQIVISISHLISVSDSRDIIVNGPSSVAIFCTLDINIHAHALLFVSYKIVSDSLVGNFETIDENVLEIEKVVSLFIAHIEM